VLGIALLAAGCVEASGPSCATVTVSVRLDGGGTAEVISDPPGIECTEGTCVASFRPRSVVTLTATPGTASFVRWGGACTGAGTSCRLTLRDSAAVEAVFLGANYVFVTSTDYAPVGLTVGGADAECTARAEDAGLPGTYVAWLSTSGVDAVSRLGSARGWVRTDGRPFADSVAGFIEENRILYPPRLDERGRPVERTEVITGTRSDGGADLGANCRDWTSTTDQLIFGSATAGPLNWTLFGGTSCAPGFRGHLYCFGTDATMPVATSSRAGRIGFLSQPISPGAGIAALDAQCATEADAASLPGTFKALVATSAASALSRFDLGTGPWIRTDGVAIVSVAADIANSELLAPIAVGADGAYRIDDRVWTGARSPSSVGTPSTTCADWTDGSAMGSGAFGFPADTEGPSPTYRSGTGFFSVQSPSDIYTMDCNTLAAVYCLQDDGG
jgi:hypothetical protein